LTSEQQSQSRRRASLDAYRDNLQRLRGAQKSAKGSPAYSVFVNRRLGRFLAAGAALTSLTPNGVTLISAVCSFAGIAVLAAQGPSWSTGIIVSALLVVGYAFDAADGQLARLRGGGSAAGEWLDHMVDCLKISALHLAVLVHLYRFWNLEDFWLLAPVGFAIVGAASFFGQILNEQLQRNRRGDLSAGGAPSVLLALAKVPTDYGVLCLVFALLGAGQVFVILYWLLFLASAAYLAVALVVWYRRMVALDANVSV
jgi:phosphatidylglycerophosphate synthase